MYLLLKHHHGNEIFKGTPTDMLFEPLFIHGRPRNFFYCNKFTANEIILIIIYYWWESFLLTYEVKFWVLVHNRRYVAKSFLARAWAVTHPYFPIS